MDIIKLKETILQDKVFLIQIFKKYSVWEKKRRPRHRDFLPVLLKVDILKSWTRIQHQDIKSIFHIGHNLSFAKLDLIGWL